MKFTSKSISLISFNTMGLFNFDTLSGFFSSVNTKERQNKIAEVLALQNPDIIALQEVHTYSFLKILRSKLKSHPYVVYKRFLYGPRGCLVIFSKLPLDSFSYINFKDRGNIFNSSIVAKIRRSGILVCRVKDSNTYILNTHLTHNGDYRWTSKSRFYYLIKSQLTQVAKAVNVITKTNSKVIVLGDFNTDKKSHLYKKFLGESKLTDLFKNSVRPTMHQEFLPKNKKVKCIDYVFIRNGNTRTKINAANYIFTQKYLLKNSKLRYLSDHLGLKADISF